MAIDHSTNEGTGHYIDVTPAQWHNFEWASEPHQENIAQLRNEGENDLPTPMREEGGNGIQEQCHCDMYPGGNPRQYGSLQDGKLPRYPTQVYIASVWCLEDYLYRIGTQLASMTSDALGTDLTLGQYAGQVKAINNCADKLAHQLQLAQEPELHCEVCGDTRLESDLDGELRCPPCQERIGRLQGQEPVKSLERQIVEELGRYVDEGCDRVYLGALFLPEDDDYTLADAIRDALKD